MLSNWRALHTHIHSAFVFATTGYEASITNFSQITLATDNVFSDGAGTETPTVTGSTTAGYVASLTIGVSV